jgi:hypothetical protein
MDIGARDVKWIHDVTVSEMIHNLYRDHSTEISPGLSVPANATETREVALVKKPTTKGGEFAPVEETHASLSWFSSSNQQL